MLFVVNNKLVDAIVDFFRDFDVVQFQHTDIYLPAPLHPGLHVDVYMAVRQFGTFWAIFLVAMLGARFILSSPLRKKAENFGDIVFWFGVAYLTPTLLLTDTTTTKWFGFWAAIIMLIGVSLVVRGIVLAVAAVRRYK
jgi:hypothetical protein